MNKSVVVYDIEIISPIRPKELTGVWADTLRKWQVENYGKQIKFCDSWTDFANMGIACIGAYDYKTGLYRVFLKDNLIEFVALINEREFIVGYNNTSFDNRILEANNLPFPASWDLLRNIWIARGDNPERPRFKGTSLNDISKANALPGKSGDGMMAALNWQMGNYGQTIDYCLRDVWLTKSLLDMCINEGTIVDSEGNILHIDPPFASPQDSLPFA